MIIIHGLVKNTPPLKKINTTFFHEPKIINHELPPEKQGNHLKLTGNIRTFRFAETMLFKI